MFINASPAIYRPVLDIQHIEIFLSDAFGVLDAQIKLLTCSSCSLSDCISEGLDTANCHSWMGTIRWTTFLSTLPPSQISRWYSLKAPSSCWRFRILPFHAAALVHRNDEPNPSPVRFSAVLMPVLRVIASRST